MAHGHGEDDLEQDGTTNGVDEQDAPTEGYGRRSVMKALGATVALGSVGVLSGTASAAPVDLSGGDVTIPAGEYEWDGSGLENSSGEAIVGGGDPGDVVLNLESGTMDGNIGGRLENIVVRGENPEPKAGINLDPGATVDGFVWPEGGQQAEDRAFYTPDGGDDRLHLRNSAVGFCTSDAFYVDKPPVTAENLVSANNNISNLRLGHRAGTSDPEGTTSYARNCTIAVTRDVQSDSSNSANARGLHIKQPGQFVIEDCYFVYKDVSGAGPPIEIDSESVSPTITFRNCHFYNDSGGDLFKDETDGAADVTIENCTIAGGSSDSIGVDYSGNGFTEESVAVPLPSDVTGIPAADEIEGVGPGEEPWDSSASPPADDEEEMAHTLVLHATEENDGTVEATFTVDGPVEYAPEAEPDTDEISENGDGTTSVTSVLSPDELDSFRFDGGVVDYSVPEGATVDVSLDGTTTTFAELTGEQSEEDQSTDDDSDDDQSTDDGASGEHVVEVIARQSGDLNYEFTVDGTAELHETSAQVTAGHGDTVTENDDGTVTVSGFTGNDGYGDAYLVQGSILSFSASPADYAFDVLVDGEAVAPSSFGENADTDDETDTDDSSGDSDSDDGSNDSGSNDSSGDSNSDDSGSGDSSSDDSDSDDSSSDDDSNDPAAGRPNLITVDGDGDDVTTYTFTVSGSVVRDAALSESTEDGTGWDRVEDIAQDGKVIGLVGSGLDAYRFAGTVTSITVDGDATVEIQRDVQ